MRWIWIYTMGLLCLWSCEDEPNERMLRYLDLVENLEIPHTKVYDSQYIRGTLTGEGESIPFSIHDGEEYYFIFNSTSRFRTESPEITDTSQVSNARQGALLIVRKHTEWLAHNDLYVLVNFPDFPLGVDFEDYLDEFLEKGSHDYNDIEDFVDIFPPTDKMNIEFKIFDKAPPDSRRGDTAFSISNAFGLQPNSYFRVREYEKVKIYDKIHYSVIFDFACDLYHWEDQYHVGGLWKRIENGEIRITFKI